MSQQECLEKVQSLNRSQLCDLWESIKRRDTEESGWQKGLAFEYLILKAFQLEGAEVVWSFKVELFDAEIEQIDGVIHLPNSNISVLVESKDYQEAVSIDPVVKMRSQLQRRPNGVVGSVFSTNDFTAPALTLAQFMAPQTILLWEQPDIEYCLVEGTFIKGFLRKYRHCIEHGKANFNLAPYIKFKL
ncbi:hypothetical protein BH09BAC4_BH09BAC4_38190 [soil metagenome]